MDARVMRTWVPPCVSPGLFVPRLELTISKPAPANAAAGPSRPIPRAGTSSSRVAKLRSRPSACAISTQ